MSGVALAGDRSRVRHISDRAACCRRCVPSTGCTIIRKLPTPRAREIKRTMRDMFYVDTDDWKDMVVMSRRRRMHVRGDRATRRADAAQLWPNAFIDRSGDAIMIASELSPPSLQPARAQASPFWALSAAALPRPSNSPTRATRSRWTRIRSTNRFQLNASRQYLRAAGRARQEARTRPAAGDFVEADRADGVALQPAPERQVPRRHTVQRR